jgi:anti-sigma factor RsiW
MMISGRPEDHPNPTLLWMLIDGQLERRQAKAVSRHLKLCWACREYSARLAHGARTFTEYFNECFIPELPPPPRAWRSFDLFPARRRAQWMRVLLCWHEKWILAAVTAVLLAAISWNSATRRLESRAETPLLDSADIALLDRVHSQLSRPLPESLDPVVQLFSSGYSEEDHQ